MINVVKSNNINNGRVDSNTARLVQINVISMLQIFAFLKVGNVSTFLENKRLLNFTYLSSELSTCQSSYQSCLVFPHFGTSKVVLVV